MNFLVDAQLPPGLAKWIEDQGHSAIHVISLSLINASDREIWDRAVDTNAIIVTKDEDFSVRKAMAITGPTIVWLRIGNATNRALLEWLEPRWTSILQLIADGNQLIEVR